MRAPLFVELCAGLASVSLMLQGGKYARPPVSRMGNKHGYGLAILRVMGLRPGQGAERYLWCEPDPGCRALLHAYTDREVMQEAARIIRSWKDEEPRALWERLRAEGPIRVGLSGRLVLQAFSHGGSDTEERESWLQRKLPEGAAEAAGGLIREAREARGWSRAELDRQMGTNTAVAWWEGRNYLGEFVQRPPSWANWQKVATILSIDSAEMNKALEQDRVGFAASFCASGRHASCSGLSASVANIPTLPATVTPDARAIEPADLPPGTVAYCDPPYRNTTGYGNDLPREDVVEMARKWSEAGARVYISEAEPIGALVDDGWFTVEITSQRIGQKRTFSKQQREWVTCSHEPAWRPAEQVGLFG